MPGTVVGPKIIAAQYIFKGLPLWCLYSWRDKNCNQLKSNMYYSVVRIKLKGHRVTGGCYVSCYLLLLSCLSVSDSVQPHRRQPTRLPRPWDSPGKNTGVGCHFLLQCRKVKSESEVTQSCPTLRDPMDFSPPGSSVLRKGILEGVSLVLSEVRE